MKKSLLVFAFLIGAVSITETTGGKGGPSNQKAASVQPSTGVKKGLSVGKAISKFTLGACVVFYTVPFLKKRTQEVISVRSGKDVKELGLAYLFAAGRCAKAAVGSVVNSLKKATSIRSGAEVKDCAVASCSAIGSSIKNKAQENAGIVREGYEWVRHAGAWNSAERWGALCRPMNSVLSDLNAAYSTTVEPESSEDDDQKAPAQKETPVVEKKAPVAETPASEID